MKGRIKQEARQDARQEANAAATPFAGKVVLITGAAGGIGRATALAFGRAGAAVVIADTFVDGGHATAGMIVENGGKALFVQANVTRAVDVEALLDKAVHHYGRVDCAVNAAALSDAGTPLADIEEDQFDRVMDVNLKGVWLSMKYQLRQMRKQGGGNIVNLSSTLGLVGAAGQGAYTAAKHAVAGLTKSAAIEYGKDGIRVNAVCAGAAATRASGPEAAAQGILRADPPLGRLADPAEIANAVLWLCSDQSSFVTGHELTVDGGFTAI